MLTDTIAQMHVEFRRDVEEMGMEKAVIHLITVFAQERIRHEKLEEDVRKALSALSEVVGQL